MGQPRQIRSRLLGLVVITRITYVPYNKQPWSVVSVYYNVDIHQTKIVLAQGTSPSLLESCYKASRIPVLFRLPARRTVLYSLVGQVNVRRLVSRKVARLAKYAHMYYKFQCVNRLSSVTFRLRRPSGLGGMPVFSLTLYLLHATASTRHPNSRTNYRVYRQQATSDH